jgi:hypothetical protein
MTEKRCATFVPSAALAVRRTSAKQWRPPMREVVTDIVEFSAVIFAAFALGFFASEAAILIGAIITAIMSGGWFANA